MAKQKIKETPVLKIRKSIVEKYINKNSAEIQRMGDDTLPKVMIELQAQQLIQDGIKFTKKVAGKVEYFSEQTLRSVFVCWFRRRISEVWLEEMKKGRIELSCLAN